jgi:hypothetical protein
MSTDVVRLMGGLGNQMFQYALARRLASQSQRVIRVDVKSGFQHDPYGRKFSLGEFNTVVEPALSEDIPLGMAWDTPWHRVARAIWSIMPSERQRVVYERTPFLFEKAIASRRDYPTYYFGYWQHEAYFLPIQTALKSEFSLRTPLCGKVLEWANEMQACRSVSVHARRYNDVGTYGDVIREAREHHGSCEAEYYRRAVEQIGVNTDTVCYVFSDDPSWAEAYLKLPCACRYVTDFGPRSDAEEMHLMARCQHHVISNSTFGWWGAWLGRNPEKIVVAPRRWIRTLPEDSVDICPAGWVRI